jgi:lipopolysaccharide export system protein LptA
MTETVKAKVADHHFKGHVSVGDTKLVKEESRSVEPNVTLRNMVREGNVVVTQGSLRPERDEKEFQEDDESGEEGETSSGEKELEDRTVNELKDLLEEKDLKKTGTKNELVERLKNLE